MPNIEQLTQDDLKIYPSERLSDTPDGGGQMVGTPLTGADNELFPPVDEVARTLGAFNIRLVYAGPLVEENVPLYGANVALTGLPKTENVSFLLTPAGRYAESREEAIQSIKSFSVPTFESRMTLLGKQLPKSSMLRVYQRVEDPLPRVGERYCLIQGHSHTYQEKYVRILEMEDEIRTFEVGGPGGVRSFERRLLTLKLTGTLDYTFDGVDYPVEGKATPPCKIMETQIADAARYFGSMPLKEDVAKDDLVVKVPSIYQRLVGTSVREKAHVDDLSGGKVVYIPTAPRRVIFSDNNTYSGDLYLETSVLPGSIEMDGYTDTALGQLRKGDAILQVDYANGVIKGIPSTYRLSVSAIPAAQFVQAAYTTIINIDDTTQGTEFTAFLQPKPAAGSVAVSWRSLNQWHMIADPGDYYIKDANGEERGTVERTGSTKFSLPALPDNGSQIIITWSPADFFKAIDGADAGKVITPIQKNNQLVIEVDEYIKPGTLTITWNDGAGKTATDNGSSGLTGDATGRVEYAAGKIYPTGIDAGSVTVEYERYTGLPVSTKIDATDGGTTFGGVVGTCQPGTVTISADIYHTETTGSRQMREIYHAPKYQYEAPEWPKLLNFGATAHVLRR